jgi:hypothetical protein
LFWLTHHQYKLYVAALYEELRPSLEIEVAEPESVAAATPVRHRNAATNALRSIAKVKKEDLGGCLPDLDWQREKMESERIHKVVDDKQSKRGREWNKRGREWKRRGGSRGEGIEDKDVSASIGCDHMQVRYKKMGERDKTNLRDETKLKTEAETETGDGQT